jgi:hypothetical protein
MSTPYVFSDELPSLNSVAAADIIMIWDTSTGLMKRCTVSAAQAVVLPLIVGGAQASVVGWYGETGVNQGTMAAAALTALATAVISAGKAAAVWGWASSTEAKAFVSRAAQAQADLETLMTKLDAVGLVSVAGV